MLVGRRTPMTHGVSHVSTRRSARDTSVTNVERRITDAFEYPIKDIDGKLVATKHRNEFDDGNKTFWFVRPIVPTGLDGMDAKSLPLYGTEALRSARKDVVIVEGEKAQEAGVDFDLPFIWLGTINGANSTPNAIALSPLKGKTVTLWP